MYDKQYEETKRPKRIPSCDLAGGGKIEAVGGEVIILTGRKGVSVIRVKGETALRVLIEAATAALERVV